MHQVLLGRMERRDVADEEQARNFVERGHAAPG